MTDCGGYAEVLAGLVAELKSSKGGNFKTHVMTLGGIMRGQRVGHLVAIVHINGKHVPICSTSGTFFYRWNNRELATVEDLLGDKALAERGGRTYSVLFSDRKFLGLGGSGKILWP
jgi:hypothetical protein